MPRRKATAEIIDIGGAVPTNGAEDIIAFEEPYTASVTIRGTQPLLLHGWNVEAIQEKADAPKGSRAKKTDNLESYVYRDADGYICVTGAYLHGALKDVGRYKQDPRSPRKNQKDLMNEAIVMQNLLPRIQPQTKKWQYEHKGRVIVQRNAITRTWPAFHAGWEITFIMEVILPQYVPPNYLHEMIALAGRIKGLGDYRPTYGRFQVANFKVITP